jgi:hypothetical protein
MCVCACVVCVCVCVCCVFVGREGERERGGGREREGRGREDLLVIHADTVGDIRVHHRVRVIKQQEDCSLEERD